MQPSGIELKKVIYLVRHGQSEDNAAPVFQSYNSPLSDKGKRQAEMVANRIKHLNFDALISSPQERAKQTADAIASSTNKQPELSNLFVERIKPSSIDGESYNDSRARSTWREWEKSLTTSGSKVEDGENYDEIVARADKALNFLQEHKHKRLVVVSHGHFIRTLVAQILLGPQLNSTSLKRFYDLISIENTGITVLHFREAYEEPARWRVWSLNDHAHFAE
jgi:broad specificity phosphatase PhoE